MLKIKYIVPVLALALSAVAALFFAACQPEDLNSDLPKGAIRLVAPGYRPSGGAKLGVDEDGAQVFFVKGDKIWVNGQECEIDVTTSGTAYIVPTSVSYPIRMVYPYSIVDRENLAYSATSDIIPIKLPGEYTYTTVQEGSGAGRQNVPAPLCAKITEGEELTRAFFKHITAAITIAIHNPSNGDMKITGASIKSERQMVLAKPIEINLGQEIVYENSSTDPEAENIPAGKYQTISVEFTSPITIPANQESYIQVPVLPLKENDNGRPRLTVKVTAATSISGVYPFEMECKKTQSNTTDPKFVLNPGELAYAPIDFAPEDITVDGLFSVGQNKKVYFSKGNLRYRIPVGANNSTPDAPAHYTNIANWAFFESQDSTIGPRQQYSIGKNKNNMTPYYVGNDNDNEDWMSLFQFGATGSVVQPRLLPLQGTTWYTQLSQLSIGHPGTIGINDIANGNHDWGSRVNAKYGGTWVTLSESEWAYLLESRDMKVGTASGSSHYQNIRPRFLKANINGKVGLIIFPDKYWAEGRSYPGQIDIGNPMSNVEWDYLQKAGVVFLPPTGRIVKGESPGYNGSGANRIYYSSGDAATTLYYWTSSGTGSAGRYLKFAPQSEDAPGYVSGFADVHHSAAVRLVRLAQ